MRITADTNVLVRALVQDDAAQAQIAAELLETADQVAVPLAVLCERVWVLRRVYGFGADDCVDAIESLIACSKVAVDRPGAEAGLSLLRAGGDFADGVIAHTGMVLGGERLATFDRRASRLLEAQGLPTLLLRPEARPS